jgi:hypothetical protein
MRTIDATLLSNQPTLRGRPALSLIIGTDPNTIDVSAYVLGYSYEESSSEAGLTIYLDNKTGFFNTLSGDKANIVHGADTEFKRGLTVAGTDYLDELPQTWIECLSYTHEGGQQLFTIECIDWLGKLARWKASTIQTWSSTSVTTILESILSEVGLTRASGSMTALSIDFEIRLHETGLTALNRLIRKMPEYLYPGLDAEIKWKDIDSGDSSDYTVGWNANHPALNLEAGTCAWQFNSITVNGRGSFTGTASDATQISNVGTRKLTIVDYELKSNANCAQRAQAELDLYEANATEGVITCRPIHGLELLDMITISSPPWGGSNTVGRVIHFVEQRDIDGRWHQAIYLGTPPDKDPGKQPAKKSKSRRRSRRRSSTYSGVLRRLRALEDFIQWLMELFFGEEASIGLAHINQVTGWHGAIADIPPGWALCDGNNGTPDLRGSFVVGAGGALSPGDTGGADEVDISHTHDDGSLATDTEADHTHGPGSLNTDNDNHSHDVTGSSGSGSAHTHSSTLNIRGASAGSDFNAVQGFTINNESSHTHTSGGYGTDNDSHDHDVNSGVSGTGGTHAHDITSGVTGVGGDATHDNRPLFYAMVWIMRIA